MPTISDSIKTGPKAEAVNAVGAVEPGKLLEFPFGLSQLRQMFAARESGEMSMED